MSLRPSRRLGRALSLVAAIAFIAPVVTPDVALADSVDDQKKEVERIVDELDRLQTQADTLAEQYSDSVERKQELDAQIVDQEAKVAAQQAQLTTLRGDLATVAVRAFTGSGGDVLGPLFSDAQSYTDGLRSDQYSRAALDAGTGTTDDLDELISQLQTDQQHLEDLRSEVDQLQATIQDKQSQTEDLTKQYTEARQAAEAKLGKLIEEEEQRRAAAAWAKLQAQYKASQASSNSNSNSSSNGGGGGGGGGQATTGGQSSSSGSSNSGSSGSESFASIPAVSGRAGVAISAAQSQLGVPYRYAASSPGVAFDCSGLTYYAWGQAGVYLPRNSAAQAASLPHVPPAAAQPGDLIFYYSPISHVGIYLGGGAYIHAPATGDVVKISAVNWNKVTAVARPG